jgi:endonuclease/exonuclease/phosphatase (EEP) superfamily protein YafD
LTQALAESHAPIASKWLRALRLVTGAACVVYALALIVIWMTLQFGADTTWPGTVLLFAPAWIFAAPLPVLTIAAMLWRRRALWLLAACGWIILWPIMDFELPEFSGAEVDQPIVRVLTANVQGKAFDRDKLASLVRETAPDVVLLQECVGEALQVFPSPWHTHYYGEFLIASRFPIEAPNPLVRPVTRWTGDINAVSYTIRAPFGPVHVFNVHFSTPRGGLEVLLDRRSITASPAAIRENTRIRAAESDHLGRLASAAGGPTIVAGDFNTPCGSAIFRRDWGNWPDAFSVAGFGFGNTKITGHGMRTFGTRIDHILSNGDWHCTKCYVGPNIDSDHLPLIADLQYVR